MIAHVWTRGAGLRSNQAVDRRWLGIRDTRLSNYPRRWNGAPSQALLVIRENHNTGDRSLDLLKWGLIPYWCSDPNGGRKPINAKSETVATLPTFRDAYRRRRCILPVDAFYEWKATKGRKQPYAIAMRDRSPFGIAGIWENWKDPDGEWVRTFAILTTPANELVGMIHDRMPAVLARADYDRWLGWTETLPDWIGAHVNALSAIGGVPKAAVCDNLKAGITKPSRYEPGINRTYQDLADHYGFVVLPTRGSHATKRRSRPRF